MNTRAISTSIAITACDVCGRTLLRGERAEIYVGGGSRHTVCELCTSRAIHTGWVREGTIPDYGEGTSVDRRRSLLGRLRSRRQQFVALDEEPPSEYEDEFEEPALAPPPVRPEPAPRRPAARRQPVVREPRHVAQRAAIPGGLGFHCPTLSRMDRRGAAHSDVSDRSDGFFVRLAPGEFQ